MFVILLLAFCARVAFASSVSVSFALNDQFPLIARINSSYSWSFSQTTFASSKNATLTYAAAALPAWLSFDSSTRTLHGTPSPQDEGTPHIKITATDTASSDSASSWLDLCVTPYPAPTLQKAVSAQFTPDNPSLSSVFLLSPNSALKADSPTLRIPSGWSFSIGFDWATFSGPDDRYYSVLQADGSPLPPWMRFDRNEITLDGVTPHLEALPTPHTLSLALHASDQEGYSGASAPFTVVVAPHELSLANDTLPTINITDSSSFDVALNSPIDFSGVLVDNAPLDLVNVSSLAIDNTEYSSWLHYDQASRRLTGQPPKDLDKQKGAILPITLTTSFNQTLRTSMHVAVVPSFFTQPTFDPILVSPGQEVHFALTPYFSNATANDVNLTASFDPKEAGNYLLFDPVSATMTGTIPSSIPTSAGGANYTHITIAFTAYSRITHSTSHASLPISLTPSDFKHSQPVDSGSGGHLSAAARKRLALGLGIAFGVVGGFLALMLLFAFIRRCARVDDSALGDEEAARKFSEKERRWYGIGNVATPAAVHSEKGYGWADGRQGSIEDSDELYFVPGVPGLSAEAPPPQDRYGVLGLGLQRVLTRTASNPGSPSQVSKAEFMGRLRATVRNVSNRYRRTSRRATAPLPLIGGKATTPGLAPPAGIVQEFSGPTSSVRGSPSSSTASRSIPHRRADFAPPRSPRGPRAPPAARVRTPTHGARASVDSAMSVVSLASDESTRTHAAEAVVHKAARATSVRSVGGLSTHSPQQGDDVRPRLVPFTSGGRVPVPQLPGLPAEGPAAVPASKGHAKPRALSQSASLVRASLDGELRDGMRYVRALGEDKERAPVSSLSARSPSGSFSSLESSHRARSSMGSGAGGGPKDVLRILVRVGERFRFRLHVKGSASAGTLSARRLSGTVLPAWMFADLDVKSGVGEHRHKDTVKFWGTPKAEDVGEVCVGVYGTEGECVGRAVVEVIARG
ncbi:hypothetical protein FA95DRAFT_854262 [Auriscalpium vulgare]|uniref:Uncharacterized protein n=1 Tax=Auriscalpium vulgare TaxID=40419 RepID=A0ACB8RAD9_9AGAM|nr:hypothetical protein FA95DRAFT_854262 [Auriscalpium vulgare]